MHTSVHWDRAQHWFPPAVPPPDPKCRYLRLAEGFVLSRAVGEACVGDGNRRLTVLLAVASHKTGDSGGGMLFPMVASGYPCSRISLSVADKLIASLPRPSPPGGMQRVLLPGSPAAGAESRGLVVVVRAHTYHVSWTKHTIHMVSP